MHETFEDRRDIEKAMTTFLRRRQGNEILDVFMTLNKKNNHTIDALIYLSEASLIGKNGITADYKELLEKMNLQSGVIRWFAYNGTVDKKWLLTLLKVMEPASVPDITQAIKEDFPDIEEAQVKKKIESLRKEKKIIWQHDTDTYALTQEGLDTVISFSGAKSPDVRKVRAEHKKYKKHANITDRSGE